MKTREIIKLVQDNIAKFDYAELNNLEWLVKNGFEKLDAVPWLELKEKDRESRYYREQNKK